MKQSCEYILYTERWNISSARKDSSADRLCVKWTCLRSNRCSATYSHIFDFKRRQGFLSTTSFVRVTKIGYDYLHAFQTRHRTKCLLAESLLFSTETKTAACILRHATLAHDVSLLSQLSLQSHIYIPTVLDCSSNIQSLCHILFYFSHSTPWLDLQIQISYVSVWIEDNLHTPPPKPILPLNLYSCWFQVLPQERQSLVFTIVVDLDIMLQLLRAVFQMLQCAWHLCWCSLLNMTRVDRLDEWYNSASEQSHLWWHTDKVLWPILWIQMYNINIWHYVSNLIALIQAMAFLAWLNQISLGPFKRT